MIKNILLVLLFLLFNHSLFSQNAPLYIWGTGLDGSVLQKTAIYSDRTNGLLVEAPRNGNNENLPISFSWRGGGLTPIYILPNGYVGLGTKNPTVKLDVAGEVKTNNGRLVIRDNSIEEWKTDGISQIAVNYYGYNKGTSQFRDFAIYNGKANRIMFVDGSTGNIGIGTSPSVKLDVNGEVRTNGGRLVMRDNSLEEWATNGKTRIAVNYYGYQRGNKQFRDFTVYNGKSEGILYVEGETKSVGIGTATTGTHKLAVNGTIGAREIKVEASAWSDFVFEKDYQLKDLKEVESFIEENKHLPDIPSEKEVLKNGIAVGEMNAKLLQKIEELMLYVIDQNEKIEVLFKKNEQLESEMKRLKEK